MKKEWNGSRCIWIESVGGIHWINYLSACIINNIFFSFFLHEHVVKVFSSLNIIMSDAVKSCCVKHQTCIHLIQYNIFVCNV